MKLFGFEITREIRKNQELINPPPSPAFDRGLIPQISNEKSTESEKKSFVPKDSEDGSTVVSAGGYFGQYIDIDGTTVASDQDLILKYRNASDQPECDMAVNYIVDEAIVAGEDGAQIGRAHV